MTPALRPWFSRGRASRLVSAAVLASLASLTLATSPRPARGAPPEAQEEGRQRFKRGVEFFKEGDFNAALAEFRRAYEVAPSYRILYNLGQTSYELQDYAGALTAFTRYLKEGGGEIEAARRAEVEAEIRKLQGRVGQVTLAVNVAGAQVTVDDVLVGVTPLDRPLLVGAGKRRISVTKAPLVPVSRVIEVVGGDNASLTIDLSEPVKQPEPPPPAPTASVPMFAVPIAPPPEPVSRVPVWIGLGSTVLLAGGAVTMGLLSRSAEKSHERGLSRFPGDAGELRSDADRARRFAIAADVLGGLALVGAGVTVYLAVRPGGGQTAARVTPTGASLSATF